MDKRKLHHFWRYLRHIHPWYFLVLTLIFGYVCVKALQHNNIEMGRLRSAVFEADKNNGDVDGSLQKLRSYVAGHMNTDLAVGPNAPHPPIQLKYTYERLQADQQQKLGQNNGTLYGEAQRTCEAQGQTATAQETLNCIDNFMAEKGVQLGEIPDALYKFDFVSARWSPDLAGWSMVATVLSILGFALTGAYHLLMRRYL